MLFNCKAILQEMAPRGWNFGPGRRRDPHEEYPFHAHIPYRFFDPRVYGRDSYDGDIGWIPGPSSPRMDDLPRQPQGRHFGRQGAPVLTSRISMDTAELLPFPRAMRKLNRQLAKTKSAYEDFQSTFNSDVENLKPYADEKVIDKLWALKLKGKKDCGDPPGEDGQEPNVPDHPYNKLLAEATYLNECLQAVRNSGVKGDLERGSKRRIDAIKRMMEKIDTHSHQILDLLNSVPNGVDYCKDLITELERLANLINPSEEANKDLYKELEGNREPDESGEEQDGDHQE